ncbi:hypothetical protein JRQ81_019964 [Phrynocephalus forsythii]|uniref:Uncharacterized protein n=1 Tax=Phrynocephalus forsythii TaxID=171643 RepID=A0A9Q1AYT7_9SAUR|nr:hypothetical protein JRQ81_019964 [Phrynocephalus forsythii]
MLQGASGLSGDLNTLCVVAIPESFVRSSKYLYSEVVIPKMLGTQAGFISMKEVSYFIRIEGNNRIIHLHQKSFIFRNMPVYTFDLHGNRQEDHPYIKVDCYYSGWVENATNSDVALSTCAGLWGFIQIGNFKYEIRPLENAQGFQHFIYRTDPEEREPCRESHEGHDELAREEVWEREAEETQPRDREPRLSGSRTDFPGPNAPSRYLEYFVVCDSSMFQREKQNITRVIRAVLQIVFILHSIFDDVGLHIVLTGMEIWARRDYLAVSDTLGAFYSYASTELRHLLHFDHASLFLIMDGSHFFGKTWQEHSCIHNRVSVSVVKTSPSSTSDGILAAHHLGHAIGLAHDDLLGQRDRKCGCSCSSKPGHCLMHSTVTECHRLSNCSKNAYLAFLAQQGGKCFLNLPKDLSVAGMCGNGLVEGSEECDCGMDEVCQVNGCCQTDCQRKPGADCHDGLCCENCKIANEGKLCRAAATECDLPEYCTGNSATCPADVYKQDGMPCGAGDSCYLGKCLDRHQHCQVLFGAGKNAARPAPLSCYKGVNMRGDRTGNCGKAKRGYKKCREEDVFCGRIQCINVKKIPIISTRQGVIQTPVDNVLCLGTEFHEEEDAYDVGAIKDGSTCGTGKICVNRSCVSLTILNYDCDFSKCNNQGVCNSNKNCHCTYGWAPPHCTSRGFGGSIDSGPPPERPQSKKTLMLGSLLGVAFLLLALGIMLRKYVYAWFRIMKGASPEPLEVVSEIDSGPENPDPTRVIEWTGEKSVCVAGYESRGRNEILQLLLPQRLHSKGNQVRGTLVELGGFSDRPVYALKHVPQTSGPPDSALQVWRMEPEETGVIKPLDTIPAISGEESASWVKLATTSSQAGCILHGLKINDIRMTEVESQKAIFVAASACAEDLSSLHFLDEATLLACSARGQLFLADARQTPRELGELNGASLPSALGGHSWTAGVQSSPTEPAGGKPLLARLSTGGHMVLTDLRNTATPLKVAWSSVPAAPGFRGVECLSVSFAPRLEGHLAVSGFDGTVRVYNTRQWDSSTQEAAPVFLHKGHVFGGAGGGGSSGDPPRVTTHAWHPSKPRTLLSAATDGSLHVWDWADLQGSAMQAIGDDP